MECYRIVKVSQGGVTAINDFGPFPERIPVCMKIVAEDVFNSTRAETDTVGAKASAWPSCGSSVERGTEDSYIISSDVGIFG